MKKKLAVGLVCALALYLLFWPVPIEPLAWRPPEAPRLEGALAPNSLLAATERHGEGVAIMPEAHAADGEGRIYHGLVDGRILRWTPDLTAHEVFADTGGRPLGMAFDREGSLIVADAVMGLLSIGVDGGVTTLADTHGGRPFRFTDDLDIADDGIIYFSDASDRFGFEDYVADLLEHGPNGRLLAYDPESGETRLLLDGLHFANGVAVGHNQEYVLVAETGKYRVLRYWLEGPEAGTASVFIDNLPAFPDNIDQGSGGIYWLALASPRDPLLDALLPYPALRKVIYRLPTFLQPGPKRYSFVLGLDSQGEIVHNLQDPGGRYAPITSVLEHEGMLYFGSILEHAFGRYPAPESGPVAESS